VLVYGSTQLFLLLLRLLVCRSHTTDKYREKYVDFSLFSLANKLSDALVPSLSLLGAVFPSVMMGNNNIGSIPPPLDSVLQVVRGTHPQYL
jgi:hypothetical protein